MYGCLSEWCDNDKESGNMIDCEYYINVGRLMGILPKPRLRCSLHDDRAESLSELRILSVKVKDCDYYDNNIS